jgi:glucose-1-phosphate thymidylyltransferase
MKVIILLAGHGTRLRPHTWSRPKALLKTAGNTVVGHLLSHMRDITSEEVIFVVGYHGDQIEKWVRENYPDLDTHFVTQEMALGQAHAVWLCHDYLDSNEVVVAFGDGIVAADYRGIANPNVDGVFLVKKVDDPRRFGVVTLNESGHITRFIEKPSTLDHKLAIAGISWFRSGRYLYRFVDRIIKEERKTLGEYFMADAYKLMLEEGARIRTKEPDYWEDAGTLDALLQTNTRLLSMDYGSTDALERSFVGGFSVVPPVYLHPTADIKSAVIGPYTSIGAGVRIRNAIVRHSIIEDGADINYCVLEKALIGENARVSGRGKMLFIGDNSTIDLK